MTDIQLHYREKGQRPSADPASWERENSNYFEHQIAYFSRNYRVIAVDTRGHGKSPQGDGALYHQPVCGGSETRFWRSQKIERAGSSGLLGRG